MATSENAKIEIESGAGTLTDYTAMTDSGDRTIFTAGTIWSGKSGYKPSLRPNGIVSGRNVLSTHADNNKVTIAAFTAYSKGALQTVTATTATFTRPSTDNKAIVYSVTMASDGSISVVKGTIGATTSFSSTRDAAGGPPLIPVESVELGQIRLTSNSDAAVEDSEIFQTVGTHTERADYPSYEVHNLGDGESADASAQENSHVKFQSALPAIHTGAVAKKVYIRYYTPSFIELGSAVDFVPAEESHSVTSTQVYRRTLAASSKSIGQCSFTSYLNDGVTDALLAEQNEIVTVRFYPDEDEDAYILTQGILGTNRSFPADNQNSAACTITPVTAEESKSVNFAS